MGEVLAPPAVLKELQSDDAPSVVRAWAMATPSWVEVRQPTRMDSSLDLDAGESEAICLALEIQADALLIDELAGRTAAKDRGLTVIGTVGLLEVAAEQGLLDLPRILDVLTHTTFQIAPSLITAALKRDAERKGPRHS